MCELQPKPRIPNGNWEFGYFNTCVPALFRHIRYMGEVVDIVIMVPNMKFPTMCTMFYWYDGHPLKVNFFPLSQLHEQKEFADSTVDVIFHHPEQILTTVMEFMATHGTR